MRRSGDVNELIGRMEALLLPLEERADPARYFLATYLRTTRAVQAELERLAAARVADLVAPGQVVLKLAVKGFGVRLPPSP